MDLLVIVVQLVPEKATWDSPDNFLAATNVLEVQSRRHVAQLGQLRIANLQGAIKKKKRFRSDTAEHEGMGVMRLLSVMCGIYLAVEQVSTGILRAEQVHQDHEAVVVV